MPALETSHNNAAEDFFSSVLVLTTLELELQPHESASLDGAVEGKGHGSVATLHLFALCIPTLVPLCIAILSPTTEPDSLLLGMSLGGDRSGSLPLRSVLGSLLSMLPIGPLDTRTHVALAIPAAVATWFVATRIALALRETQKSVRVALTVAFATLAGVLLEGVGPPTCLMMISLEMALASAAGPGHVRVRRAGTALGMSAISAWAIPWLLPLGLTSAMLAARASATRRRKGDAFVVYGLAVVIPTVAASVAFLVLRPTTATIVLGEFGRSGGFLRPEGTSTSPALLRASWVVASLVVLRLFLSRLRVPLTPSEQRALVAAAIAFVTAAFAPTSTAVALILCLPVAALTASAMSLLLRSATKPPPAQASEDSQADSPKDVTGRTFRAPFWAVAPALALGLAARTFEERVDIFAARMPAVIAVRSSAGLFVLGNLPPSAVVAVSEVNALYHVLDAEWRLGLRPDLQLLPTQHLLMTGAGRRASTTLENLPPAREILSALLSRGTLQEGDISPLSHFVPFVSALEAPRLEAVARHVRPLGAFIGIELERVDPSDRRRPRAAMERRVAHLVRMLESVDVDDPLRRMLRVAALREVWLLSRVDREAAHAALVRASRLGTPGTRLGRFLAKLEAKLPILEQPTDDL